MDKISGLPDDLLLKILSFVPTKDAVSTSILSKRWEHLWMWLSKLDYTSTISEPSLGVFINKYLPLHRSSVIESLRLDFSRLDRSPEEIRQWIDIAVSRHVHELELSFFWEHNNIFPSSLFTCKSLVTLKLRELILKDVPSVACLPSLKTLEINGVTFIDKGFIQDLLSICPVLEDLTVHIYFDDADNIETNDFTIIVPSLQSLSLTIDDGWFVDWYEIYAPSLKYLKLKDSNYYEHDCLINNMPKLKEAYMDVTNSIIYSVITPMSPITSVKSLTVCSEGVSGDGVLFNQLEELKLCVCKRDFSNLLGKLLKGSPNLQVLEISVLEHHDDDESNDMVCWNQPSSVPECLLSSLQTFKWSRYFGRPQDGDIAVYILKNALHLKTATFLADTEECFVPYLEMVTELALSSRASRTCELVFFEGCHIMT